MNCFQTHDRKWLILQLGVHESWHIFKSSKQSTFKREVDAGECWRMIGAHDQLVKRWPLLIARIVKKESSLQAGERSRHAS
jgi:hypothetical protein